MNVLSLFDGMSCGRVALERAGISVTNYYSSEVDPYAIKIAEKNWEEDNLNRLGDVRNINISTLPKIDVVLGGSPCQSFSLAGKQNGMSTKEKIEVLTLEHYLELKEKGFEFEGQSYLFWEYMRILKDIQKINPEVKFLLENVNMPAKWETVLTKAIGVKPICINSALVSAQNRKRLYWTNIENVTQPEDKEIFLKDIVLDNTIPVALHNLYGGFKEKAVRVFEGKSPTIRTAAGGGHIPSFVKDNFFECAAIRGRYLEDGTIEQKVEMRSDGKTNALTTVQKDNVLVTEALLHSEKALEYMNRQVKGGRTYWDFKHRSDIRNPKSSAVVANFFKGVPYNVFKDWDVIRKFHPIECEKLQTLPVNYTEGVSDTQRYKMIGNGWTVDVIAHILKGLKCKN